MASNNEEEINLNNINIITEESFCSIINTKLSLLEKENKENSIIIKVIGIIKDSYGTSQYKSIFITLENYNKNLEVIENNLFKL